MDLRFQIKFDEKIYREQAEIQFNIALDKNKNTVRKYVPFILCSWIMGAVFLGLLTNAGAIIAGSIFTLVGMVYFGIFLNYHYKVRKCRAEFMEQIHLEVARLKEKDIEIGLTNEHFTYNDGDIDSSIRWTLFNSFVVIDEFLFLVMDKNNDFSAFYIHESQIGPKKYTELKGFVASILKPYPNKHSYKTGAKI